MTSSYIGAMESVDAAVEEWSRYLARFQQVLFVNDVTDPKKQVAFLITVMGHRLIGFLKIWYHQPN